MVILAIDYGEKRIGLAIAEGSLAEPLEIMGNNKNLFKRLNKLCRAERVKKIVLGLPGQKEGEIVKKFAKELEKVVYLPIVFWDEAFTSKEAQRQALASGKKKKGRKNLDSIAAAIILQEYLDNRASKNVSSML